MDANQISRILTLIFSFISLVLDLYYYVVVVNHSYRWVKLSYVFVHLGWIIYMLSVLFSGTNPLITMANLAGPMIALTTMVHAAGSSLRLNDILAGRTKKR